MLQGSLEDFSLDEVLGLVANTNKTGELRIDGDRGDGRLWLDAGALVAGSCSAVADRGDGDTSIVDTVFELLRFRTGSFSFISGIELPSEERHAVDEVLRAAAERVAEWTSIAAVVPSLDHTVRPAPELADDTVTLDRDDWSTLIAIGEQARIGAVIEQLSLDEMAGSRRLKALAERSLIEITEPSQITEPSPITEPAPTAVAATVEAATEADPVPAAPAVSPFTAAATPEATPVALTPPTPGEIEEFGSKLDEPFDPAALVVENPADLVDSGDEHSLLMRYLKSDS